MMMLVACQFKLKPNEEDAASKIEVQRYDRLESRYLTTGDFSALQQMNTDYPIETRTLVEKMLQIGEINNPDISHKFLMFYQDSILQTLLSDVGAEYANMDDINNELKESMSKLQKWLPGLQVPVFYAQVGAFDQSIVIGENSVGISLDKYMGENYPIYQKYYTKRQMKSMTRQYIVPDCLTFYLLSLYPMKNFEQKPQLERDLHMGKIMWIVNKATGKRVYKTPYIKQVAEYMASHKEVSIRQLIEREDYSDFKK